MELVGEARCRAEELEVGPSWVAGCASRRIPWPLLAVATLIQAATPAPCSLREATVAEGARPEEALAAPRRPLGWWRRSIRQRGFGGIVAHQLGSGLAMRAMALSSLVVSGDHGDLL